MSTPDIKSINDTITTICAKHGIMAQTRTTGNGTTTRYVDMPGRTVNRVAAAAEITEAAKTERAAKRGAEAMIYTMAAQIVMKVRPSKKAAK